MESDGQTPPPDKVTIYDVAQRAGVSIATVSNTINRPERVSSGARQRVLKVVDELGFVPKQTAVSLARKGVGRIGVLAPFTSYPSYAVRLNGILEACTARGVQLLVFDAPSPVAAEQPLLQSLPTTGSLDGLLIMGLPLEERTALRLQRRKLATVLVDSFHRDFDCVNVNDRAGGYAVGAHLIAQGHRRFAFIIEGPKSHAYESPGRMRYDGFVEALQEAGLDTETLVWAQTGNDMAGGREVVARLLAEPSPPTAFFCHHDDLAAGVLSGLRSAGLSVPSDAAVVGYDDTNLAEALDLTSVAQPFAETGRIATTLLLEAMEQPSKPKQQADLSPRLVVRGSS